METSAKTAMNVNEIFMAIGTFSSLLLTLLKPGAQHRNMTPVSLAAKTFNQTPHLIWLNLISFRSSLFMKTFFFLISHFSQEASEERAAGRSRERRTGQRRGRLTGGSTSGQKRPVLWRRQLTIGPISWQMHPRTDTDTQTQYESIVWNPFTYDPALNYGQLDCTIQLQNWKLAVDTLVKTKR